jgi:hypothetical protein
MTYMTPRLHCFQMVDHGTEAVCHILRYIVVASAESSHLGTNNGPAFTRAATSSSFAAACGSEAPQHGEDALRHHSGCALVALRPGTPVAVEFAIKE